jgi:Na+/melibiose symporter-like transporter
MGRIGKTSAWALGLGISAVSYLPLALVRPGPTALPAVLVIFAVAGGAFSVSNVATPAVLGDIADYEGFRGRRDLTGTLFALQALIEKFNLAVGGGVAFLLIGAFGYAARQSPNPHALFGLQLAHFYLPALLNVAAIVLLCRFPLTAHRQSILQRWRARGTAQEPA